MESILDIHIKTGIFHHAYLLVGDFETSRKMAIRAALALLKPKNGAVDKEDEAKLRLETHPDFFYKEYDLFSIDDSHEIIDKASKRPFSGEKKVFILEINGFSTESANALLKTFEEPYESTHFFVLLSSLENILPTLRSRLLVINIGKKDIEIDQEQEKIYIDFLKGPIKRRMEIIKEFLDDRFEAINFLNGLEIAIYKKNINGDNIDKNFVAIKEVFRCRPFLLNRGGSPKMILEHIALSLPEML